MTMDMVVQDMPECHMVEWDTIAWLTAVMVDMDMEVLLDIVPGDIVAWGLA